MHSLHQATIVFLFLKDLKKKKKIRKKQERKTSEGNDLFG